MIYIVHGNDTKRKNSFLKSVYLEEKPIVISKEEASLELITSYSGSAGLFGGRFIFLMEEFIKEDIVFFKKEDLIALSESDNVFIFLEEKLTVKELKKYENFSEIKVFNLTNTKEVPKINIFNIADYYSRKNKIGAWMYFRKAIDLGVAPEEIIGVLLWKIRTMFLGYSNFFS